MPGFRPQLTRAQALGLAHEYMDPREKGAMAAGKEIRQGRSSGVHLRTIYEWKTRGRGRSRLNSYSEAEICEALQIAVNAAQPRSAIAVLTGLYGVHTPVASAIATVIHPDRYTIIDFRALHALGQSSVDNSIPFYLAYLDYCISLASRWDLPLRNLDRALWQWSRNQEAD